MCSVLGVFCVYDWSGVTHQVWLQLTVLTLFQGLPLFLSACSGAKNIFCLCDNRINGLVLIAVEHARSSCFWMPQTTIIQWQSNSGPGAGLKRSHLVLSYIALYFEKALSAHAVLPFHCTTHLALLFLCIACYIILCSAEWPIFYGIIVIMQCLMGTLTLALGMDR